MKIKDINFKDTKNSYSFIRQCLFNEWETDFAGENYLAEVKKAIRKAKDTDDLAEIILNDERFLKTQVYSVLVKYYGDTWKFIRNMFGDKSERTMSDIGGLKIADISGTFSLIIPNGMGDGTTRFAVLEENEFYATQIMRYFTLVEGKFNIYSYDCGTEPYKTIEGKYSVYYYDGLIAFVRRANE